MRSSTKARGLGAQIRSAPGRAIVEVATFGLWCCFMAPVVALVLALVALGLAAHILVCIMTCKPLKLSKK